MLNFHFDYFYRAMIDTDCPPLKKIRKKNCRIKIFLFYTIFKSNFLRSSNEILRFDIGSVYGYNSIGSAKLAEQFATDLL